MVTEELPVLLKIAGISESVLFLVRYIKFMFMMFDALRELVSTLPSDGMYAKFLNSSSTSKSPLSTPDDDQYATSTPTHTGIIKGSTCHNISKVITAADTALRDDPTNEAAPTTA